LPLWLRRIPSYAFSAAVATALLYCQTQPSRGDAVASAAAIFIALAMAIEVVFGPLVVMAASDRVTSALGPPADAWRWLVRRWDRAAVVGLALLLFFFAQSLTAVRFGLSQASFESAARRLLTIAPEQEMPRWIGLFRVERSRVTYEGFLFFEIGSLSTAHGFEYRGPGCQPRNDGVAYWLHHERRLSAHWFEVSRSTFPTLLLPTGAGR